MIPFPLKGGIILTIEIFGKALLERSQKKNLFIMTITNIQGIESAHLWVGCHTLKKEVQLVLHVTSPKKSIQ